MDFNLSKKLSDFIWVNGKFIPWGEANVHVLTHGLHYASSVFEGERAYNGKVFKLLEHTKRLIKSAEYVHLKVDYSVNEIIEATEQLLKKNNLKNAYIRPLIWTGAESLGIYNPAFTSNLMILATESNPKFKKGVRLSVTPWRKPSVHALPPQSKSSAHYAMLSVSRKIAQDQGFDEALLLDEFDDIAESSTTNIFFGKEGLLVTPIADRFLNGITRQTVIELARNMRMRVREERITLDDISEYDTCFLTGTSSEIKGVSLIDSAHGKCEFNNDKIVDSLQQEYAKIVGKEL